MKHIIRKWGVWLAIIAFILMVPLIAMQFTDEIRWDVFDFVVMGSALLGLAIIYELVASKSGKMLYRTAFLTGLVGAFLLFWVNGAVGIIGNEGQDANLLYVSVFVVLLAGAWLARFKSKGMSITMFVAAAVQMLVPVVAWLIWPPHAISWAPGVAGVFLLSAFFAVLFLLSAVLFGKVSSNPELQNTD